MPVETPSDTGERQPRQPPLFYREFLAEREEILRNKWFLSEGAGRDVGFDVALIDWVTRHREQWIAARKSRRKS